MTKAAHPGARASRPHPLPWVVAQFPCDGAPVHRAGGNRMGPAQAEPGRLCRSIRVEEMGEALPVLCGRDARAPGWASSHDVVISRSRYRRCIRARLVIEGGPSLFVFIRVHWWFVFKNDWQFLPRMIRPPGRGPDLFEGLRRDRQDALRVDQIALHSSLSTLHPGAPPSDTTGRLTSGETGVFQKRLPAVQIEPWVGMGRWSFSRAA